MSDSDAERLIKAVRQLRDACEVALNANRRMWGHPSERSTTGRLQALLEKALNETTNILPNHLPDK